MSNRLKIPALFIVIPVAIGMTMASCNNKSSTDAPPPPTEFAQPVIQPLKFSKPKKIYWDAIKAVKVNPVVTKLNWDKLPEQPYDTTGFKPFKYPVEEAKFDYNSLPEKDLDIDKLPSHPLKFKTYILPPPKVIKGAKLELNHGNLFVLGFGEASGGKGIPIAHLFTDRDGFLWIATWQGLYRYDGEYLLSYAAGITETTFVWDMLQDVQGNIWLSIYNQGIEILDPKHGTLRKSGTGQGLGGTGISRLLEDDQQRVWVTTAEGVKIFNPKTQTVKLLDKDHGLFKDQCTWITTDKNDKIWISAWEGGINIIDLKNKKIKYLDKTNGLKTDAKGAIICDRVGRVCIGLNGGLINMLNLQKKTIQTISEAKSTAWDWPKNLLLDNKGRVWVGTSTNGLEIIDTEKRLTKNLKKSNILISENILDTKQDNQGQVWIATGAGLNMISDNRDVIEHIGTDSINNLMEDHQGLIWQSTLNGVDILHRKNGTSRHLGVREGLANDDAHIIKEIDGSFFISTDSGVDKVDTTAKTIMHFKGARTRFVICNASLIWYSDMYGTGINIYDIKNSTVKHLDRALGLHNSDYITWMYLDRRGRIWISLNTGKLEVVDRISGNFQFLDNIKGLRNHVVRELIEDNNGNMWMGTDDGIYIANIINRTLVYFTAAQGLINNKVLSLLEHAGRIYAGTNLGITIITPPTEGITANKKWQVKSYAFAKKWIDNYDGDLITKDSLYWSGDVGINVLDLSKKDTTTSTPYITGISVLDQPVYFVDKTRFNSSIKDTLWEQNDEKYYLKGQLPVGMPYATQSLLTWDTVTGIGNMPISLKVPYNQNFIRFNYSSLNLTPHDSTFYRYILIGYDKKWSDATSAASSINYINLQPGNYTFEVSSKSSDNGWSKPAVFSFSIMPPWWQTWWAYTLYVLLFGGVIWGFVTLRSRQLVKEKRVLEHKVQIRTQEVMQQKEEIEAQRDGLEKAFKELKTPQTQLIQSEKMASLGELTAGIAHEIQNPLNFINNFSDVNAELIDELKQEVTKGNLNEVIAIADDIKENEQKISHHGKRADGIVKGMLEHSRSRSGQKEPTDLNVMADEYMRLSYHGLRAKDKSFNSELITHFDAALPKIEVVQQDMGRVLLNLFNNAFYAVNQKRKTAGTDYKPEVTVTTLTENGQLIIKVKDNGIGIPDAIKEKIMQPFFTTKPTGEGTGLGLSLSYDMIVKGHGGSININSTEGDGSEFTITLPVS